MSSVDIDKWRQGVMFSAPSVSVRWSHLSKNPRDELVVALKERKPRSSEKFVLISQDCDIVADKNVEPLVEALLCTRENDVNFLRKIDRNSSRKFVVDPEKGLVAEAKYRVQIAKEGLNILTPEPWLSDTTRFERFVKWLARRYDRPAVPDVLVNSFQKPIENTINRIGAEYPDILVAFNSAVYDVRVSLPSSEEPPFEVQLIFLLKRGELTKEEADAINIIFVAIQSNLDQAIVHLNPELLIRTDDEISFAEHKATRPLFLEYLTFRGEEVEGARPY